MTTAKNPSSFGAWVRTRRRQRDLTQAGLGKRAGCSAAAIRKIEADERKPSRQLAELLARVLEIPAGETEAFLSIARGRLSEDLPVAMPESVVNPHNLPTLLTATINRQRDLAAVTALLRDSAVHLVTLLGPPGIGKTRLSLQCGYELQSDFVDGVWFVDLAEIDRAEFFLSAVARALPTLELPPSPNLPQLLAGLQGRQLLLILDNFEHLVEEASLQAVQLLKGCPGLKLLATSRIPLQVYGEREYPLPPLAVPPQDVQLDAPTLMEFEAVQLFVARIRDHQPGFRLSQGNAPAVVVICAILEGIPLALELAAATTRNITLEELAAMLRGRDWLGAIGTHARDLPERQRTLEKVIEWSFNLLDEEQQTFFCKLGLFSGWWQAAAAGAICGVGPVRARDLLQALTQHSLLVREPLHGQPHWRMLEIIQAFAATRLSEPEREALERRRAAYYLDLLQVPERTDSGMKRDAFWQAHRQNLHATLLWAIETGAPGIALPLVADLMEFWEASGYLKEGLALARRVLELPGTETPRLRAEILKKAADLAWQQSDFESAVKFSNQTLEFDRKHGLGEEEPWFYNRLGRIHIEQGKLAEAREALQAALELARQNPAVLNPGSPLAQLGEVAFFEGDLEGASRLLEQALTYLSAEEGIFLAVTRTDLAEIALARGNYEQAHNWLAQAIELSSQHIRRFMVFLSALAGYLVLSKEDIHLKRRAAEFYGTIEALSNRSGVFLGPFYQDLNRHRIDLIRLVLPAKEWHEASETGRNWERSEALERAREALGL